MKFYQYLRAKHIKTELFFAACLLSVLAFYPSAAAMYACALLLPIVFGGLRGGLITGALAVLCAYLISSFVMITEVKRVEEKTWVYATTWGTLIARPELKPGDVLSGKFHKQKYAFVKAGRFARGYYFADRIDKISHVPLAADILRKRAELSDNLFLLSGGRAYLTQALALGDRRYLPDYIRDIYTITGLGHLLAVSGLHTGLYAGLVFALFFFLPMKLRSLPVMAAMLLLMPFTGFKVTVMRGL